MKELDVFRYLKKYREDRTLYEHNLIDTDYNGYVIQVFSSAPASSSPAVQEQLQGEIASLVEKISSLQAIYYETNDEYNEYLGVQNIMMLSSVRVTERFPILIFAVLIMVIFGALGCAGAALFGRIEDFKETGLLMQQLETHDLTFAFGPFLLYLLLHWRQSPRPALWLAAVCFFFLVGLKRIAIPAVALGLLAAWLLELLPEKAARQAALCAAIVMMVASFLYIAGIRYGLFPYLEEQLGIDTKGRTALFAAVEPYYDISFTYTGKGTGFERYVEWFTGAVSKTPLRTQTQIHNDFLRMYLNIGFIGYWVWIWSWLPVRLRYWFRQGGKKAGCLFLGVCVYCFVLYATDNTIYYPYTMMACALIPMSCRLDSLSEAALDECSREWEEKGRRRARIRKPGDDPL